MSRRAGRTVAAVADQQPAGTPGSSCYRPVRAIADQGASQQRIGGSVDQRQQALLEALQRRGARGLGRGVYNRTSGQNLHKLAMKK
ncbi:hypothetical protein BV508_28760 [Mycobacterium intermedium]|nr:hypothetical protein BV508_28760 [Mycobacterium intermedium]